MANTLYTSVPSTEEVQVQQPRSLLNRFDSLGSWTNPFLSRFPSLATSVSSVRQSASSLVSACVSSDTFIAVQLVTRLIFRFNHRLPRRRFGTHLLQFNLTTIRKLRKTRRKSLGYSHQNLLLPTTTLSTILTPFRSSRGGKG